MLESEFIFFKHLHLVSLLHIKRCNNVGRINTLIPLIKNKSNPAVPCAKAWETKHVSSHRARETGGAIKTRNGWPPRGRGACYMNTLLPYKLFCLLHGVAFDRVSEWLILEPVGVNRLV